MSCLSLSSGQSIEIEILAEQPRCLLQVQKRLVIAQPSHEIRVVDKNGIRTVKKVVVSSQQAETLPPSNGIVAQ